MWSSIVFRIRTILRTSRTCSNSIKFLKAPSSVKLIFSWWFEDPIQAIIVRLLMQWHVKYLINFPSLYSLPDFKTEHNLSLFQTRRLHAFPHTNYRHLSCLHYSLWLYLTLVVTFLNLRQKTLWRGLSGCIFDFLGAYLSTRFDNSHLFIRLLFHLVGMLDLLLSSNNIILIT